MNMVEKVARALAKLEGTSYSPSFKELFDAKARVAIEAMRDPTSEMMAVLSGWNAYGVPPDPTAMNDLIDAAMKES